MAKKTTDDSKTWARAKDILTILVIPLLLWGVRQEIRLAGIEGVVEEQAELRQELHELEVQVATMGRSGQINSQGIEELYTRLEHITETVDAIDRSLKERTP
ncbi:hypothetical protein N9917_00530 [Deltaproteobacteria bacterium]|nr:hypothetical protein [Deltaproteobacteria bacterium]